MNATAIQAILAVVLELLPKITTSSAVQTVIDMLNAWLPTIITFFKNEIPVVKQILAILEATDETLPEQRAAIKVLHAQCDAGFDDALALARAADAAAASGAAG